MDGDRLASVDGKLSLRFIEPMEEVNYIDQLRLVAVDHPENVEVNPDERFLDDPPFASGRVVASQGARLPVGAWDGEGRDVLDVLSRRDHKFASGFTPTPYDGFANLHSLTLDLGDVKASAPLRLLMTGYVNYFSATSLYAAWQAGIKPISPYVEAQMAGWNVGDDSGRGGIPGGAGADDCGGSDGQAARGNAEDSAGEQSGDLLGPGADRQQCGGARRARRRCRWRWRRSISAGIRSRLKGKSPGDLDYDYDRVSLTGPFQHQRGNYTHLGDVTALVKGIDDRYAIFGSGEEIAAEFDATKLPALPAHWKRDYFFYANGYVKDMDWWDASPFTVAQLPFHKMSTYPYPASEKFPDDAGALDYQLNWNDRFDSGEPVRSYRFDYQLMPSTPADDGTCGAAASRARPTHADAAGGHACRERCVLEPAVRQLEMLRARRDLRGGTGRGAHPAD